MKYNLTLIVILSLMLCLACTEQTSISEKQIEDTEDIEDNVTTNELEENNFNYDFSPTEAELAWSLHELDMDWHIDEKPDSLKIPSLDTFPMPIYSISNNSNLVNCWLNLTDRNPLSYNVSIAFKKQTSEEYQHFQQKDWPLLWTLLSKLSFSPNATTSSPDAIISLGEQCMDYFNSYTSVGPNLPWHGKLGDIRNLLWYGKQDDINCTVHFMWNTLLNQYVPSQIDLVNSQTFNYNLKTEFKTSMEKYQLNKLSKISEVEANTMEADDIEISFGFCLIKGRLENIRLNDDILDTSTFNGRLPENIDLYKKATLKDETSEMTVYVVPAASTDAELSKEQFHILTLVKSSEPFYVIEHSINDTNLVLE